MKPRHEDDDLNVKEQAAKWLTELADGASDQQVAFARWLRESPRHVEEFLLTTSLWRELDGAGPRGEAQVQAAIEQALTEPGTANIRTLKNTAPPALLTRGCPRTQGEKGYAGRLGSTRKHWWSGIAASLLMLAGVAWFMAGQHTYSTTIGEQRAVRLDDGSIVQLNTQSKIAVRFSGEAREVRLLEGQALFTVERDATRPFQVMVGNSVIRALGTRFDVYRRATEVTVSVIEGAVQIEYGPAPSRLAAGEQARILPNGKVERRAKADLSEAIAWRDRRLVFRAARLADIATEFARYNPRRIEVEGAAARNRQLTASFAADDPDSLVLFLKKMNDLEVETQGDGFLVRSR